MKMGDIVGGTVLVIMAAVFASAVGSCSHERSNIDEKATTMRGVSICERSNSTSEGVEVGIVYRGRRDVDNRRSTVRCINNATGEITSVEFKNVLYRERD